METSGKGALTCARYAFAPNLYHYCGPETNGNLGVYLKENLSDRKLVDYLSQFETLYPYLVAIARANKLKDPFNEQVVEAYWVGNKLLERVTEKDVYEALTSGQQLTKRLPQKEWKWLLPKIDRGIRLHHSFHVLNIFTRTGHRMVAHTVETMDECRISWGKIQDLRFKIQDSRIKIASQRLIYRNGKLKLVPIEKEVVVVEENLGKQLKPRDWVSVHWGIVCDKLTVKQVGNLEMYSTHQLKLANETI
jgi:hypothetical protein